MEKAKQAVSDFMSKAGHHDTTVHEKVSPAVTHETVTPHRHEKTTTAVDKEVHQDHYHTSVQPVHDREVLPEKHHHNTVGVEHRQFEHGNDKDVSTRLEREAAQFKDKSHTASTRETRETNPVVSGEHVHHHVHETIQPVIHKETVQPHVVHTTVPIHEVHHNAAQHHSSSALPAVSMADFKKQGGTLTGRDERYDGFEGEPRHIGGNSDAVGSGSHSHHHHHHNNSAGSTGTGGALGGQHHVAGDRGAGSTSTVENGFTNDSVPPTQSHSTSRTDRAAADAGVAHSGATPTTAHHGSNDSALQSGRSGAAHDSQAPQQKPSLMQKLNPKVDADGDGKAGMFD